MDTKFGDIILTWKRQNPYEMTCRNVTYFYFKMKLFQYVLVYILTENHELNDNMDRRII